jgi:hypothetical protein
MAWIFVVSNLLVQNSLVLNFLQQTPVSSSRRLPMSCPLYLRVHPEGCLLIDTSRVAAAKVYLPMEWKYKVVGTETSPHTIVMHHIMSLLSWFCRLLVFYNVTSWRSVMCTLG